MLGEPVDALFLSEFDKKWREAYYLEKGYLKKILSRFSYYIQHIGSTCVGGYLLSRPIVDIAISAFNIYDQVAIKDTLNRYTYTYVPELSTPDCFYFTRNINSKTYFTVRVNIYKSPDWYKMQAIQNALFASKELRIEFTSIKRELLDTVNNDKMAYAKEIRKFHNRIIKKM